jgi:hypothetical protein
MHRRAQVRLRLDERKVGHAVVIDWLERLRDELGEKRSLSDAIAAALATHLQGPSPSVRASGSRTRSAPSGASTRTHAAPDAPPVEPEASEPSSGEAVAAPSLADAAARMFADV